MKLERRIEYCTDCSLAYYKPFYEPMWLAKIMWMSAHKKNHTPERLAAAAMSDYVDGVTDERERIIKLLEENLEGVMRFSNANLKTPTSPEIVMSSFTGDIIALIKGENK